MTNTDIYKDISARTNGAIMIGVVGPVRTGKSTFIKRFMETLVIPNIDDEYMRERARDELPQSGSGRTIMTAEPKFVPEEAVQIRLGEDASCSVRLVDCVGYMVSGASGRFEDGSERLVTTPWFDHEVTMTEAAESGTRKVICDHSTIGLVITTDGSICDIDRGAYVEPEERVVSELQSIGKPFVILLNSAEPDSEYAIELETQLAEKYSAPCMRVNCQQLNENGITEIMRRVLGQFPLSELSIKFPDWFDAIEYKNSMKSELFRSIINSSGGVCCVDDIGIMLSEMEQSELVEAAYIENSDMGSGVINIAVDIPRALYYKLISDESGLDIQSDGQLVSILREMSAVKQEYDKIKDALESVNNTGYGVVMPDHEQLQIEEPQLVKQGGKYAVKLKARAPAIHMLRTGVETVVSPSIGGDNASEEIISFLLQGFDGDMSRLWESNIFGRPLYDIAQEGIAERLNSLPQNARAKLQETLQRIVNEGRGTLICILL
ncbi:MAG: stage IV sporulation protein A [Oscillospiraceae bacterium]|nr:stage IV sporulation protein A [Oscillospiraceae bacterium]